MKKNLIAMMILMMVLVGSIPSNVIAIELPLRIELDGNKLSFPDAQPFIDAQGRTQTPARFIGEALGAVVTWDGVARTATFVKDNITLIITIDNQEYTVNGKKKQMDTVAMLKEDRTFVPARYVAEALGASVKWVGTVKTVYITSGDGTAVEAGTTTYYDGVGFNSVSDTFPTSDLMSEAKSAEFCMNLIKDVELTMVNGRYMINAVYPELPEGYTWVLSIDINYSNGKSRAFESDAYLEQYDLPETGSFTKDITDLMTSKDIDFIYIVVKVKSPTRLSSGHLDIVSDDKSNPNFKRRCHYCPKVTVDNIILTDQLDFEKLFQWK